MFWIQALEWYPTICMVIIRMSNEWLNSSPSAPSPARVHLGRRPQLSIGWRLMRRLACLTRLTKKNLVNFQLNMNLLLRMTRPMPQCMTSEIGFVRLALKSIIRCQSWMSMTMPSAILSCTGKICLISEFKAFAFYFLNSNWLQLNIVTRFIWDKYILFLGSFQAMLALVDHSDLGKAAAREQVLIMLRS